MNKLFLLFSHDLTEEQSTEINEKLRVDEIVKLPNDIQEQWSNIPPEGELDTTIFNRLKTFLEANRGEKNYVLVQGEFGAVYHMVNWCLEKSFIPIYSTTKRVYEKQMLGDGTIVNKHFFNHVNFRYYKK